MRKHLRVARWISAWLGLVALGSACLVVAPAHAAPARPDLRISTLAPSATSVAPGAQLRVTVKTLNGGKAQARASRTRVLLSRDAKLDHGDVPLTTLSIPKLKKGRSKATTTTVRLPRVTGSWRLLACADATSKVRESKEGNNCKATGLTIKSPAPPVPKPSPTVPTPTPTDDPDPTDEATIDDLVFGPFTSDPSGPFQVGPAYPQPLTVRLTVSNPTGKPSGEFDIRASLSENEEFDEWSGHVAWATVAPIAPGGSTEVALTGIEIEQATADNAGTHEWFVAGVAQAWTDEDVHARALATAPVTITWDPDMPPPEDHDGTAPDLVVTAVTQSAPFDVYPSQWAYADISVTVKNQGNEASGPTEVSYTWRPDQPAYVFYENLPELEPGESTTVLFRDAQWTAAFSETPPLLIACADRHWYSPWGSVTESDEANNCASQPVQLLDGTLPPGPVDAPGDLVLPQTPAPIDLTAALTPENDGVNDVTYWFDGSFGTPVNEDRTVQAAAGVSARFRAPYNFVLDNQLDYAVEPVALDADEMPFTPLGAVKLLAPDLLPDEEVDDPIAESDLLTDKPVTVTFTLSGEAAVPASDQVLFTADFDGSNVRFAPIKPGATATDVTAQLDHFGIVGIASATPEQREALGAAWPDAPGGNTDRQFEHVAGEISQRPRTTPPAPAAARMSGLTVGQAESDTWWEEVPDLLLDSYNTTVVPAFAAANADLDLATDAIRAAFVWERQVQLLGLDEAAPFDAMSAGLKNKINHLIDRVSDRAEAACRNGGGVEEFRAILSLVRQRELMGMSTQRLWDALSSCNRIQIEFVHRWKLTDDAHDGVPFCTISNNPCGDGSYTKSRALNEEGTLKGTLLISLNTTIGVPGAGGNYAPLNWENFTRSSTELARNGFSGAKPPADCTTTVSGSPGDGSFFGAFPDGFSLSKTRNGPRTVRLNLRLFANNNATASLPGPKVNLSGGVACDNGDSTPINRSETPAYVKPVKDPQLKPLSFGTLYHGTAVLTGFGSTYSRFWHNKTTTNYVKATGPGTPGGPFAGSHTEEEWTELVIRPAPPP